jgi:prepilin-type processing-associated H-X9-DG protein
MRCPADDLPPDGIWEKTMPGVNPAYPEGVYYGTASYGFNWGPDPSPQPPVPYNGEPCPAEGMFHFNRPTMWRDVLDGLSNTILMGERSHFDPDMKAPNYIHPHHFAYWYASNCSYYTSRRAMAPTNFRIVQSPDRSTPAARMNASFNRMNSYGSGHGRGANLAFCDGSVKFVSEGVSLPVLKALSTKAGPLIPGAPLEADIPKNL